MCILHLSRILSISGKSKKEEEKEDESDSGEPLDEKEWCSVSSDEAKVVHVHENNKVRKGKSGKTGKDKKVQLDPEEAKKIKEENSKVMKVVKKTIAVLEPCIKAANKASKSTHADEDFKNEVWAAKEIVKKAKKLQDKYKGRTQEQLTFEHDEETAKIMKDHVDKKVSAINHVAEIVAGGFDPTQLELLCEAAKKRKQNHDKAQDVQ